MGLAQISKLSKEQGPEVVKWVFNIFKHQTTQRTGFNIKLPKNKLFNVFFLNLKAQANTPMMIGAMWALRRLRCFSTGVTSRMRSKKPICVLRGHSVAAKR